MNSDFENTSPDAELEDAIQHALRVDTDPQQLARLKNFWSEQSQRHHRQQIVSRAAFSLAAAAAVLAIALFVRRPPTEQPIQLVRETPRTDTPTLHSLSPGERAGVREIDREPRSPHPTLSPGERVSNPLLAGRAPTTYEQAIFLTRSRTFISPKVTAAKIESAVLELAANGDLDPQQLLATAGLRNSDAESALLRKLPPARDDERGAILRLLAVCGSWRSVSPLLQLATHDANRKEALATIEKIVRLDQFPQLIGGMQNASERRLLLSHLLASPSEAAHEAYLALVRSEPTRADALAVAQAAPKLQVTEFVALLDHPQEPVRVAAAMLLGYVNGPEITRLLIARVTEKPADSTEAWMALIACRGELAQEFLANATHRPQLLVHFNSARVRWVQIIQ